MQMTESVWKEDTLLDIQKKLAEFLKLKREIQLINEENDLENVFFLGLQKRLFKPLKKTGDCLNHPAKGHFVLTYVILLPAKGLQLSLPYLAYFYHVHLPCSLYFRIFDIDQGIIESHHSLFFISHLEKPK